MNTLPYRDIGFDVNMLTGEVDVHVNGGDLVIMKLTAAEFQHLAESAYAALDLVVPKPQALPVLYACCSSDGPPC